MLLNRIRLGLGALIVGASLFIPAPAAALEKICDVAYQNCRKDLVALVRAETKGLDVAFWFMEDHDLATEIISRWNAGVPVRVLMDTEANASYPDNVRSLQMLKDAGIPMREKISSGILHWKLMIFLGQNTVQFSGANYSREAFGFGMPYADYVDEIIYFTGRQSLVDSFKTKYDDAWTNTTAFRSYANVTTLARAYATFPIDPELNFSPAENFRTRSVNTYRAEPLAIDTIMYRITDRAHADAMIAAVQRGVPVRLYTEQKQYRDVTRMWHSYNVDRMYKAGIQIRDRQHTGINHEKLTILHGLGTTVFGSSNWTSPSADTQYEHNLFTRDQTFYNWAVAHFNRKWNNEAAYAETKPFVPLPPGTPVLQSPAHAATGQSTTVKLTWNGGSWAHKYDVYVGTSTTSMSRVMADRELGPNVVSFTVSGLTSGRTYYWKVVGRTMADLEKTSETWSFSTGSSTTTTPGPLPSGWSTRDIGAVGAAGSASYSSGTYTLKGSGVDIWGTADEFRFAYTTLTGDGTITARISTLSATDTWTKAGVMMRETLTAGSKHASMFVSSAKGLAFQRRAATGGTSTHTSGGTSTAPHWVRVTRRGNTFSAYVSSDGSTWTLVGSQATTMTSTIYVGLALTSHRDGALATASVTNVAMTP